MAEVFGQSFVETDRFIRTVGLPWASERTLQAADNETQEALQAYADGVNAYISEVSPLDLPLEFKLLNYRPASWQPLDTIALTKFLGWSLSGSFEDLQLSLFLDAYGQEAVDELFPINSPFPIPIIPQEPSGVSPSPSVHYTSPGPAASRGLMRNLLSREAQMGPILGKFESMGSNNWVVSGERTSSGAPILANDPHLGLTAPAIWYMLRLSSPSFNVYGVSLLGAPLPVLGYNEHISWGFTNVGADVVDFFIEEVRPGNDLQYLYRGQWTNFEVRDEVIGVRGGGSVHFQLRISRHGPVISDLEVASGFDDTIAMQWTGHQPTQEFRAIFNVNKASNWEEFRAALEDFHVPAQNIIYADAAGNIGLLVNGLYPVRDRGLGRFPVEGSSGDYDWNGSVRYDQIPASYNPDQGFLVSANQIPTLESEPYLGWSWADRYRAARINEVLNSTERVSVDDVKALQLDHVSVAAREFVPYLIDAFRTLPDRGASLHSKAPGAISLLASWDYEMVVEDVAPTLYSHWISTYRTSTFVDEWMAADLEGVNFPSLTVLENMTKFKPSSRWFDDVGTSGSEERDDIIRRAFVDALDDLEENFSADMSTWRWGDLHVLQLVHLTGLMPLSSDVVPRPGDASTVDVAGYSLSDGRFLVTSGPSWRLVVDYSPTLTGSVAAAYGVYPGGQSGRALSPHYMDLFELWRSGEYVDLGLTEGDDFEASSSPRR